MTTSSTRCTDSRQLPGGFAAAYLARRYATVLAFPEVQDQSRMLAAVVNVAGPAEIPRCKLVPDCPCLLAAPPTQDTNRPVPFTPIPDTTCASAADSEGTPMDSNADTVSNEVMPIRKLRWCWSRGGSACIGTGRAWHVLNVALWPPREV